MNFKVTTPCKGCPFTKSKQAYSDHRLEQFASGIFHCHKTGDCDEEDEDSCGEFVPNETSSHCAGALIYLQKRKLISLHDNVLSKLNMEAKVR